MDNQRNPTRAVRIGSITIGNGNRIAVQSMTSTRTRDIDATVEQVKQLAEAGADVVRVAVDNEADARALAAIRQRTNVNLSVDLQENYRLTRLVAPHVDKIRYNPGHLYHFERDKPWQEKVQYIAETAKQHDCALRVGVNCGSVDPEKRAKYASADSITPMVESALEHCAFLDSVDFSRYCVSLKDSDPAKVVKANQRFAEARPDIPVHLGVTEAGLPPEGVLKTRRAFEPLLMAGVGDTIRVSLTVPNDQKGQEIAAGRRILADVQAHRLLSESELEPTRLNIVACPSCSRVENQAFVELAQHVKQMTAYAKDHPITIAVMGCRVNGPGETDDADLGLWCGPRYVNLKRGSEHVGAWPYDQILVRLKEALDQIIEQRRAETGIQGGKPGR
ncbi:MAG: (E)-4-hydroxy-3-methylbut-2-enyl-diphosphate synthase [Planctomycetota bacterium]